MPAATVTNRNEFCLLIRESYPPLLRFEQAAEIANEDVDTVYDWSSCGYLDEFKTGKRRGARLMRDPYCRWLAARN